MTFVFLGSVDVRSIQYRGADLSPTNKKTEQKANAEEGQAAL